MATTPITGDILEGITRRSVLQMAHDLGIPTEQREIDRSELYIADEAFFCGTGVQIAPIASIDGRRIGESMPGPITKQISDVFFGTVRGQHARYSDWLTPVRKRVAAPAD